MSIMSCISGLESMSLGGSGAASGQVTTMVDGYSITERTPAADSIQKIGGIDGLRVTMHFLFMNLDVYYPPLPLDLLEVLTRGLVERVCDGRLEEGRAAEIAIRRAWILLECNVSLPLTPADADRVYGLIHYRGLELLS